MKYKEFLAYLEANLEGYHTFMSKARTYQMEQNAKRQKKSRWSDEKMDKAAYDMWKKSMEPLHNNLKAEIKSDFRDSWVTFIEKNNIFEIVNEGISDLNFDGVA